MAACCGLPAAPAGLGAQFQALDTPKMRLIYTSPLQSYLVPQVAASFERALRFHEALFDYVPSDPTNVLMHDLWHYGNAGARPLTENHVTIGIAPYSHDYESSRPRSKASSMTHELAHIFRRKRPLPRAFRRSLGRLPRPRRPLSIGYIYLTVPRGTHRGGTSREGDLPGNLENSGLGGYRPYD